MLDEDIALPREVFSGEGPLWGGEQNICFERSNDVFCHLFNRV